MIDIYNKRNIYHFFIIKTEMAKKKQPVTEENITSKKTKKANNKRCLMYII